MKLVTGLFRSNEWPVPASTKENGADEASQHRGKERKMDRDDVAGSTAGGTIAQQPDGLLKTAKKAEKRALRAHGSELGKGDQNRFEASFQFEPITPRPGGETSTWPRRDFSPLICV